MLKYALILSFFVAGHFAASVEKVHEVVPIISQESDVEPDGHFHYSFESADGTKAEQHGELKTIDKEQGNSVSGAFEFVGTDGKTYHMSYTADENGFVPVGDYLPQAPEVPPAIARALKYIEEHPYKEETPK